MDDILGFLIVALLMGAPLWLSLLVYLYGRWKNG